MNTSEPVSNPNTDTHGRVQAEALGARLPPLMVAALRVAETVSSGTHGRRRVGHGESFWQFRPYQTGDSAEQIDWRQSAKGDRLFIRETEWAAAQTVWLWRDGGPGMDYRSDRDLPTKRQRAELLLGALAALLVRGGERIGLLGGGRAPATGRGALGTVLAGLERATPIPIDRTVSRHATLALFGDFLDPIDDIQRRLDGAAEAGAAAQLVQILDPAEAALSFAGRVRFLGLEPSGPRSGDVLVPRVESIRAAYRDALERHQESLRRFARSRGWDFLTHTTDEPPEQPLRALYGRLAARLDAPSGS